MTTYTVSTYYCEACDTGMDETQLICDGYGECYCPICDEMGPKRTGVRPANWVSVAAYETSRSYGGPEEGGWYYTEGYPVPGTVREFAACDFPQIETYKEHLRRQYDTVRVDIERRSRSFPAQRPRYC